MSNFSSARECRIRSNILTPNSGLRFVRCDPTSSTVAPDVTGVEPSQTSDSLTSERRRSSTWVADREVSWIECSSSRVWTSSEQRQNPSNVRIATMKLKTERYD